MYVLLGVVILIGALVAYASTRPTDFRYVRVTTIQASPERVFAQVNDFHRWEAWSPWARLDPQMETTYSGAPAGHGAKYAWNSKSGKVGAGSMLITDAQAPRHVVIDLHFTRPFKAENVTRFTFEGAGGGTTVTWEMTGKNGLVSKIFGLFMNMDKLIGADFDRGLASLKRVAEAS